MNTLSFLKKALLYGIPTLVSGLMLTKTTGPEPALPPEQQASTSFSDVTPAPLRIHGNVKALHDLQVTPELLDTAGIKSGDVFVVTSEDILAQTKLFPTPTLSQDTDAKKFEKAVDTASFIPDYAFAIPKKDSCTIFVPYKSYKTTSLLEKYFGSEKGAHGLSHLQFIFRHEARHCGQFREKLYGKDVDSAAHSSALELDADRFANRFPGNIQPAKSLTEAWRTLNNFDEIANTLHKPRIQAPNFPLRRDEKNQRETVHFPDVGFTPGLGHNMYKLHADTLNAQRDMVRMASRRLAAHFQKSAGLHDSLTNWTTSPTWLPSMLNGGESSLAYAIKYSDAAYLAQTRPIETMVALEALLREGAFRKEESHRPMRAIMW